MPAYLSWFIADDGENDRPPLATLLRAVVVACSVAFGFLRVFAVGGALVS